MLSNAYFLAKFRFDTAENEPAKNLQNFRKMHCRNALEHRPEGSDAERDMRPRATLERQGSGTLERSGSGEFRSVATIYLLDIFVFLECFCILFERNISRILKKKNKWKTLLTFPDYIVLTEGMCVKTELFFKIVVSACAF